MKKTAIRVSVVIIIAVMLLPYFVSCQGLTTPKIKYKTSADEYEVFDNTMYEQLTIVPAKRELYRDVMVGSQRDQRLEGTKKIIWLNGRQYVGVYQNTRYSLEYGNDIDFYEDELRTADFGINRKTGRCVYFENRVSKILGEYKTEDECYSIAEKVLKRENISVDLSEYRISSRRNSEADRYEFTFVREHEGLDLLDHATVNILYDGTVDGYRLYNFGTLNGVNFPNDDDLAVIADAVDKKYEERYAPAWKENDIYQMNYVTKKISMLRLYDGRYAMEYELNVTIKSHTVMEAVGRCEYDESNLYYVILK